MKLKCQLKEIRHKRKVTQQELSDLTDISINQISFIENDKQFPTAYTLWKISEALNCKVDDLYINTTKKRR